MSRCRSAVLRRLLLAGLLLLPWAGRVEAADEWRVATWNVIHGWGRHWAKKPDGTPACSYGSLSYNGQTGGTACIGSAWGDPAQPMQRMLRDHVANDPKVVALGLNECNYCVTPSKVQAVLGWTGSEVFTFDRDGLIARHGFVRRADGTRWTRSFVLPQCPNRLDVAGRIVVSGRIWLDAAHTRSVHVFVTRIWGDGCRDPRLPNGSHAGPNLAEVQALHDFVMREAAGAPVVLMGDMNFRRDFVGEIEPGLFIDTTHHDFFTSRGYRDAYWHLRGSTDPDDDHGDTATWGARADFGRRLFKRIDYVFTANGVAAPVYASRFNDTLPNAYAPDTTCAASDHAGVVVGFGDPAPPVERTTVVVDASAPDALDATIRGGTYVNVPFGTERLLVTRASADPEYARRALLVFPTAGRIPAGARVVSARLSVEVAGGNTQTRTISVYDVRQSWREPEVTWASRWSGAPWTTPGGTLGSVRGTASVPGTPGAQVTFDVTGWVAAVAGGAGDGSGEVRLALVDAGAASRDSYREYHSLDATVEAARRPRLVVVYEPGVQPRPSPSPVASPTPRPSPSPTPTASPTPRPSPSPVASPTPSPSQSPAPYTVAFVRPTAGATVSGTVAVEVAPSRATTRVDFFVNGVRQATLRAAPFVWQWNTTTAANGARPLYVQAYSADGKVAEALRNVTVKNP
jgi:hypothetical protein